MRLVVAAFVALHGALHLIGVFRAVPGQSRAVTAAWLVTALLWLAAAGLCAWGHERWWIPASVALVASQWLIFGQWRLAWAGSVANGLLIVPIVIGIGVSRFHDGNRAAVEQLLAGAAVAPARVVTDADLAALPAPVSRWLRASGVVGRPIPHAVRLHQRGVMRTAPDATGMTVSAVQHFTVDQPGFVWAADVRLFRVIPIVGRDRFMSGTGRMLIRLGGVVTVADGTGPNFDQGTALRYLGEIVWFPAAALASSLTWQPIDANRAEAHLAVGGQRVTAVFEFDAQGRFVRLSADRYLGGRTLERWEIPATEWRVIRGIQMPVKGGAVWKLAAGDFNYYDWEVTDVEPDPAR